MGLPVESDASFEQIALTERLRRDSIVPVVSVRARLRTPSRAARDMSRETWGSWQPEYAA
jgi:hypothetical protein